MNTRAILAAIAILAAFAAGWILRDKTTDRYRIFYGDTYPIIKIDTRTGATWRYFQNTSADGKPAASGFVRLQDF